MSGCNSPKKKKKKPEPWKKDPLTGETRISLYQTDVEWKVWRKKKEQHKTSSVKHGAGSVMAWTYKAASGTDTLTFIDNFTADRSNRVNIE